MLIACARVLPIEFTPGPNPLGIVSTTIRDGYPAGKEMFWFACSTGAGLLGVFLFSRLLSVRSPSVRTGVAMEALGVSALLAMLFQPPPVAEALAAGIVALAIYVARSSAPHPESSDNDASAVAPRPSRRNGLAWTVLILGVSLLLVPGFWARVADAMRGALDDSLIAEGWTFHAEWGQHLAWANGLAHGQLPGRDLYCLYGPLYGLGLAGAWALFGRSIDVFQAWWAIIVWVGIASAVGLAAWHLRRKALALLVPTLSFLFTGRYGLGLFALLLLSQGFTTERLSWYAAAGAVGGISLLFSQEFGAVFLVCAGLGFGIRVAWPGARTTDARGRWPEMAAFAAGLLAIVVPCAAWLAYHGALLPMLRDLAEYPTLVMEGFGKLPFPSILESLPLRSASFDSDAMLLLRLDYATAATYVAAIALVLRVDRFDPRTPIRSLRRLHGAMRADPRRLALLLLAIYAILSFRSALGRSSLARTAPVAAAAAMLLVVAIDRALDLWRRPGSSRALLAWRAAAITAFIFFGGFLQHAALRVPAALLGTVSEGFRIAGFTPPLKAPGYIDGIALSPAWMPGAADVNQVTRWIRENTAPDDAVLFLPNHASFYYLIDRPSPIRFVLSHQMVTDAHRAETLAALRARPPRYIVWAPSSLLLDGLPHEAYIGSDIMDWIHTNYQLERRIRSYEILGPRKTAVHDMDDP
jgi:hypothetical protein